MNQGSLFDLSHPDQKPNFPPVDPTVASDDVPRLSAQSAAILARLRQGPATNIELREIAWRYPARVGDLKEAGFRITSRKQDGAVWVYTLEGK